MFTKLQTQRLRLLLVAGLLAPMLMALAGATITYLTNAKPFPVLYWPSLRSLGFGILLALLSTGLIYALSKGNRWLGEVLRETGVRLAEEVLEMAGYPVMLVVVVGNAIGEEILFRGGLQPLIGLIPTMLLFGFSHGGWRRNMWAYALVATLSGGLYGAAYELTGDLWICAIAHALHNIMATVLAGKESRSRYRKQALLDQSEQNEADPEGSVQEHASTEGDSEAEEADHL